MWQWQKMFENYSSNAVIIWYEKNNRFEINFHLKILVHFEDRGNCFAFSAEKYKYFDTRLDSLSLFESGLVKYLLTFSMLKIESLFDIT